MFGESSLGQKMAELTQKTKNSFLSPIEKRVGLKEGQIWNMGAKTMTFIGDKIAQGKESTTVKSTTAMFCTATRFAGSAVTGAVKGGTVVLF